MNLPDPEYMMDTCSNMDQYGRFGIILRGVNYSAVMKL